MAPINTGKVAVGGYFWDGGVLQPPSPTGNQGIELTTHGLRDIFLAVLEPTGTQGVCTRRLQHCPLHYYVMFIPFLACATNAGGAPVWVATAGGPGHDSIQVGERVPTPSLF